MKRIARFLINLYPRAWRARYGDEFQALLDDSPPHLSALFDLLKGALQMQFAGLNFTRLALTLSLAGLVLGFAGSFLITPTYESSAELMITQAGIAGKQHSNIAGQFLRLETEILSRTSLSRIIQDPRLDLYKNDRRVQPLEDVIETMRTRNIHILPVAHPGISGDDTLVFQVDFAYSDPHKTQAVVQTVITRFQELNINSQSKARWERPTTETDRVLELESRIAVLERKLGIHSADSLETDRPVLAFNLAVLDPPSLPELPAKPNRPFFAAIGFGSGFMLAILVAIFRRRIPPPAVELTA